MCIRDRIVKVTPWHEPIRDALWLPSRAVIVLALVVVGMRLGDIAARKLKSPGVDLTAPLIYKLVVFPTLMLLISPLSETPGT